MSILVCLWLVYSASLIWIVPLAIAATTEAECKFAFSNESHEISMDSQNFTSQGYDKCEYNISAPTQYYIQLNFTKVFGFPLPANGDAMCLPKLSIAGMMNGKKNQTIDKSYEIPHVFQSFSNSIQIIYVPSKCPQESGFTLSFNFLRKEEACEFLCDSGKCLPATSLCDGTTDCIDKTDEEVDRCVRPRSDHAPYIVILSFVVLITLLGVIVCLLRQNNCRMMSRVWHRHPSRDDQLQPQSQNSEVITSSPTQEQIEQHVSLLPEQYNQILPLKHSNNHGYPTHVQRSKDGEEGYRESQKDILNHRQISAANTECFRPPPNKTVHDTESPPPYSDSPNRSFDSFSSKTPPSSMDLSGCPVVIRCYSMSGSANGGSSHLDFYSNSHSRTHFSGTVGVHRGRGAGSAQPPGYESYGSSSVPSAPSVMIVRSRHSSDQGSGSSGSRSSSVQSSPPDYRNAFSVTSTNMYRSASDQANV